MGHGGEKNSWGSCGGDGTVGGDGPLWGCDPRVGRELATMIILKLFTIVLSDGKYITRC